MLGEIHTYEELRVRVREALQRQHPEWVDANGTSRLFAVAGTCGTCGRPLTQVGPRDECLRCLVSLGFLSDSKQREESETSRRLTPGLLKYHHFEVEVGADGFPIELGAGAMAITYRAPTLS